jgi:hypothetical protein
MVALERFETVLKVYDHDKSNPDNPTPLSRHNEFTQTTKDSIAARQIKSLIKNRVPQKTNMSLVELMNLPCEAFKIIVTYCKQMDMVKGAEKASIADILEDQHNELS